MVDALGDAMLAYYNGEKNAEVIVRTNVAEDETLPASYFFREGESFPEYEKLAMKHCKGKILDLGAGGGCHSLYLASKAFDVTSVDISKGAVEVMNKRNVKNVIHSSVYDLPLNKYDTILLLMNGIGMAQRLDLLADFLIHLKKYLNPGGQILLDSTDLQYLFIDDDGAFWVDLNSDYYGNVEYNLQFGDEENESFPWLYVDPENLISISESSGFRAEILMQDEELHYLARLEFSVNPT